MDDIIGIITVIKMLISSIVWIPLCVFNNL